MSIKVMTKEDFKLFWPIFSRIVKDQETYAYDVNIDFEDAYTLWCEVPLRTFIFEQNGKICGSYYIKSNSASHRNPICNCGYIVDPLFKNQGIAKKLCKHSQNIARELGFKAMQFNAVVSTNVVAVYLWQKMGFKIIETLPNVYEHKNLGLVDCYVMYKEL
jgi:GNAT superfamily N-acetyltransferase